MSKTYTDADLRQILGADRPDSAVIDQKIQETYEQIRRRSNKNKIVKKAVGGFGAAAAAFMLAMIFCAANPSLAAELPVIGSIFAKVQEIFPFGKMPEDNTTYLQETRQDRVDYGVLDEEGTEVSGADSAEDMTEMSETSGDNALFKYQAADQGLTFILTEYYASNQAVFIGVRIENEESFPEMASFGGNDGYQLLQLMTTETYSFRAEGDEVVIGGRNVEGKLEDEHTFIGIMRIDYDSIRADDRKYIAAYEEAEAKGETLPWINAETYDLYIDQYEVPDSFQMQLQIDSLRGYPEAEGQDSADGYRIKGTWTIPDVLNIQQSTQGNAAIWINETNAEGIGLEYIEISPIELTLHPIENGDRLCIAVAFDKDGRWLQNGSTNFYELAVQGHDISVITVYVCNYDEYMDELKGIPLQQGDGVFQEVLEERALYKKVIDTSLYLQ